NFVADIDKDGCAQITELHDSSELDSPCISAPLSGFPVIGPVLGAVLTVLEDCRQFSALMVPRDGLIAKQDRDSISTLGIACHPERNQTGSRWLSSVQRIRQQGCGRRKCRNGEKLAAVQMSQTNHIVFRLALFRTL